MSVTLRLMSSKPLPANLLVNKTLIEINWLCELNSVIASLAIPLSSWKTASCLEVFDINKTSIPDWECLLDRLSAVSFFNTVWHRLMEIKKCWYIGTLNTYQHSWTSYKWRWRDLNPRPNISPFRRLRSYLSYLRFIVWNAADQGSPTQLAWLVSSCCFKPEQQA